MNIKQLTLTVMAAVTLSQTAVAVPADPRPKLVRQADGSYITVVMAGDEHAHVTLTADGIPLYYNAATRNFEYARLSADGRFEGSGISAADARQRDSRAKAYIGTLDIARIERAALATTMKNGTAGNASQGAAGAGSGADKMQRIKLTDFPTTGKQKTLVVLVEFDDLAFTTTYNPHDFYTRMLNEEGFTYDNGATGSARDFYLASSNGLFDPEFVVVGPIKLEKSADYYGGDYPGMDYYAHEMIVEACKAIDETVDFTQFDGDGDGYVDNIYCFYAGPGQADSPGATLSIWPHSAELADRGVELACDGKRINHYACSNEVRYHPTKKIPAGIGTFVHEFGHVLGLADHYDSADSRTFTVGEWDTMATGSYNNDGNTPPVFSAFERAELGWLSYTDIAPDEAGVKTLADLKQANAAFRVTVPGNENEYFIFENRQQTGWDAFLPGHGMLVWHIDMDRDAWTNNTVNTIANHQRVDIVPADGVRNTGTRKADPFPGTDNIRQFDMKAWDGSTLLALDDVVERAETIRFAFANTGYKQPAPEAVSITETADSSFVMAWSEVPSAAYYIVNVSTTGADGTQTPVPGFDNAEYGGAQSVAVTGLLPATEYTVSVVAGFGSYRSEPRTAVVTTLELAFEKVIPTGLMVAELYSDGFTAAWDAVDGADGYVVSLCKHSLSANAETSGYDFGELAEGMPELWSTAGTSFYSISGYYGEAAPSLRMSADGDCLEIAYPDSMINGLSLWCRMRNGKGSVCIDRLVDGQWVEASVITPETAGGTAEAAFEPAERVRVRFARESGFLLVDDVKASVLGTVRTPVEAYNGLQTGNVQSFTFRSLDHNATYGLRVSATSSGRRSLPSAESVVVTSGNTSGIADIRNDADRNTDLYDLSGRKVSKGNHKKGIYIVPGKGKIVK
ncbi:MAG: M6 family metalloprotease domain-containing protein [Prevotella sp.]|nr:M6 family metalloprotease domain-containing protein [Prevotella sp.]